MIIKIKALPNTLLILYNAKNNNYSITLGIKFKINVEYYNKVEKGIKRYKKK